MTAVLIPTSRALTLLTCCHLAELSRARVAVHRLVLMRDYAACLHALGCPVRAWWRK